jgi:transcription initiation factor TFIIIB Brf1 subunit/transcription initiation factor TFIIB
MEVTSLTVASQKFGKSSALLLYDEWQPKGLQETGIHQPIQYKFDCCEKPEIIESKGIYVCRNCAIDHGSVMQDYLTYDIINNNIHTEKKFNYPVQFYGSRTVFSLDNLSPKTKGQFYRLSKLNRYFHNAYEYNMTLATQFFNKFASQLEIPHSIVHKAMRLYIKVVNKKLTIGRSIKNLTIACLYIACMLNDYKRTSSDFSMISLIPEKTIRKNYRLILKELNINAKTDSPSSHLVEFAIKMGLSVKFQSAAIALLTNLSSKGININSSPRSFAAAAIYVTSKKILKEKRINQNTLSEISKVSEVTIRKYIKLFRKYHDFITI